MIDDRLEELSNKVRNGIPIDITDAIKVIEYQAYLQIERINNKFSLWAKFKKWFKIKKV